MQLVDYEVLKDLAGMVCDSDGRFMTELMDGFASDARRALERMRACARSGEAAALAREAHRLKGTSGTIGAAALAGECREMERCARAGSCVGMEARVDHAAALLETSYDHIAAFFRGNKAATA